MGSLFSKDHLDSFVMERVSPSIHHNKSNGSDIPWYADVEVDQRTGCRKFGNLPPRGHHPRLFFTKEELPSFVARFSHSSIGPELKKILTEAKDNFLQKSHFDNFPDLTYEEMQNPSSKDTTDKFFKADETRNVNLLCTYVYGIICNDQSAVEKAKQYAIFHAKVILRSKEIAVEQNIHVKPYVFWHNHEWTVPFQFIIGGTSYALLFDLLYNELSSEERELIRNAILTVLKGRKPWGIGFPARRIQSNWSSYHGDYYTLSAVVEENENMSSFADLMSNFLNYGIYDSGHPIEDAYVVNLALREGSLCFLAMARRGHNFFAHANYMKLWKKWLPYALEPTKSGKIYGGSSGSCWMYPTSAVIAKFMFPKDSVIDYVYRTYMCENGKPYSRLNKMQCRLSVLTFALPSTFLDTEKHNGREKLDLDPDFICRDRGKVIMWSDWSSENATSLTLDARPDAFLVGHDTCSRGTFVLNSGGRNWGYCPEWNDFTKSSDYSLPLIDGEGQQIKAPFVKLTQIMKKDMYSFVSADLTYAYNWRWENGTANSDLSNAGFEKEDSDPRDFGFNVWWAPYKVHDEPNVGFNGLHMWRKRINQVRSVGRNCLIARGKKPFVMVGDNVRKDDGEHEYTWCMTTCGDALLEHSDDGKIVLKEEGGERRLIVQNVSVGGEEMGCRLRTIGKGEDKAANREDVKQLQIVCTGIEAKFKVLMYSVADKQEGELTCKAIGGGAESQGGLEVWDDVAGEVRTVKWREADGCGCDTMWIE